MQNNSIIKAIGLRRTFNRRPALAKVDFELPAGAFHVLLGPNGAGKSTLIKIMMRQLVPSAGDCLILGASIYDDRKRFGLDVAYVSEEVAFALPTPVGTFARLNANFFPRWNMALFNELIAELGISPLQTFGTLSRGQKMRFFLALALARQPKLLLLDEVTATLDALGRFQVYRYLETFTANGGTVVMATNIPADVQAVSGRILYLDAGRIMINQSFKSICQDLTKLRLAESAPPDGLFSNPAVTPVSRNSDGSISYLAPSRLVPSDSPHLDRRALTVEELVVYLLRSPSAGGRT